MNNNLLKVDVSDPKALLKFEESIVVDVRASAFLLPATLIKKDGARHILYKTDGFISLHAFAPYDLGEMLAVVDACVSALIDATCHLLDPCRFFISEKSVFIKTSEQGAGPTVRLIYGRSPAFDGSDELVIMPLLKSFSERKTTLGAESSMHELINRIYSEHPGLLGIPHIIEDLARTWHRVLG